MGNTPSTSWPRSYVDIKATHDEAYRTIEEAITLEEQERQHEAIEKYKQGILLIDKALNIQVTFPENPNDDFQKACSMIQKMKKTRAEVLTRINCIQSSPNFTPLPPPAPPTYDEAIGGQNPSQPQTYVDLATALDNLTVENVRSDAEVIYTQENVRLFFISPTGEVTATSQGHILRIAIIEGSPGSAPRAFLQIGDWIYPLVPGVSPCYRTNYGAFIFPNLNSDIPDATVAFMLSEDADSEVYDLLENILHGIVGDVSKKEALPEKPEQSEISSKISGTITTGAYYISKGLIKGAEKTGDLFNYTTPKLINKLSPAREATHIPQSLSKTLRVAETATSKAANVTGFVADKVGTATVKLGHFLAPHIKKQGTRILTTGLRLSEKDASAKVDGVLTVAAGAVEGFSTIYRGLESSASILGKNLKDNSVKIVEHKYGNPAGEVTADTFDTVGNVMSIAHNSKVFTPKGLAKQTAKETGKAIVKEYHEEVSHPDNNTYNSLPTYAQATNQSGPSTSVLYPDLLEANNEEEDKNSSKAVVKK